MFQLKGQDWTKEELEKLQEHYGKMPNKELREKYLPNRTPQAMSQRANSLDITQTRNPDWTGLEKNL